MIENLIGIVVLDANDRNHYLSHSSEKELRELPVMFKVGVNLDISPQSAFGSGAAVRTILRRVPPTYLWPMSNSKGFQKADSEHSVLRT